MFGASVPRRWSIGAEAPNTPCRYAEPCRPLLVLAPGESLPQDAGTGTITSSQLEVGIEQTGLYMSDTYTNTILTNIMKVGQIDRESFVIL